MYLNWHVVLGGRLGDLFEGLIDSVNYRRVSTKVSDETT